VLLVRRIVLTILLMILPIIPSVGYIFGDEHRLSLLVLLPYFTSRNRRTSRLSHFLVFVALFRLSLNIATDSLILLDGYAGHIN